MTMENESRDVRGGYKGISIGRRRQFQKCFIFSFVLMGHDIYFVINNSNITYTEIT